MQVRPLPLRVNPTPALPQNTRLSPTKFDRLQPRSTFNMIPQTNQPLVAGRVTGPPVGRQVNPQRGASSFLTFPAHLSQQQIPGNAIGLNGLRRAPVPGPTVKWPTARTSFLGSVVTGTSMGVGLSGDPDYLSKGVDILLHRETGSVYCPVCETTYSTNALTEHIFRHKQLEEIASQQNIQEAALTHAGLSAQEIHAPVIVQPEEFIVQEEPVASDNFFVVDNTVSPSLEPLPPLLGRQNIERTPLQYPIEHVNFYSCCDGYVNRDPEFNASYIWTRNDIIARPRPLTEWERQNLMRS